jgi:hypothetical protein
MWELFVGTAFYLLIYLFEIFIGQIRSFGCVLYELITLDKLFKGEFDYETMTNILKQEIILPSDQVGNALKFILTG